MNISTDNVNPNNTGGVNPASGQNGKTESSASIFVNFNDTDNIIDVSDAKYSQAGVESEEINNFFGEHTKTKTKWTNALKKQFFAILDNFNSKMSNKDVTQDISEYTDFDFRTFKVVYGSNGKVVKKLGYNEDGIVQTLTFNENEQPIHLESEERTIDFEYTDGKLTKMTEPKVGITTFKYDDQGHLIDKTKNANGNRTRNDRFEYDSQGRQILRVVSSKSGDSELTEDLILKYEYDDDGKVHTRAFLPTGEEFENPDDSEYYLFDLHIGLSATGEKDFQQAAKRFKFKQ